MNLWRCKRSRAAAGAGQRLFSSAASGWIRGAVLGVIACVSMASVVGGQDKSAPQPPPPQPLAVIDGQTITDDLLPSAEQAQLQRMMAQVYGVKLRALHAVLDQKLLAAEAKKKGVSVEELLKTEADAKVPEPTDAEVSAYYQASQAAMKQPLEEMKEDIRKGMRNVNIQKAQMVYVQGLWQKAVNDGELVILLNPPKINLPVDPARVRGDAQAPVTIVEFSDFSCPFCRKAEPTMVELLAKYPGKVRLAYRDFPLSQLHPNAELAAEASRCAGEQGRYWDYHDLLFASAQKQGHDDLLEDARALKLDDKQFDACLSSGRYRPQVEQDIQMGSRGGVVATPGFFVNGIFVSGAQPAAAFEKIIDEELISSSQKAAQKKMGAGVGAE